MSEPIQIDPDDIDILETFDEYAKEYKPEARRRWGRMSWLYPGEFVCQISGKSAQRILAAQQRK